MAANVRHAMRILELLVDAPQSGLRVSDIAASMGVNKAIAHRLLATLVDLGYASKDDRSDLYRPTFRLGALGLRQIERAGIESWAQEVLDDLAQKTSELVRMAIADGDALHWIGRAQGSNSSLRIDPAAGAEASLHATATGKAWLSVLPESDRERIIDSLELVQHTPFTIVDREQLRSEVDDAAARGYATVDQEVDLGISAIAVPIRISGQDTPALGTISVAGPSARLTKDRLDELVPEVLEAASELATRWPLKRYAQQSDTTGRAVG